MKELNDLIDTLTHQKEELEQICEEHPSIENFVQVLLSDTPLSSILTEMMIDLTGTIEPISIQFILSFIKEFFLGKDKFIAEIRGVYLYVWNDKSNPNASQDPEKFLSVAKEYGSRMERMSKAYNTDLETCINTFTELTKDVVPITYSYDKKIRRTTTIYAHPDETEYHKYQFLTQDFRVKERSYEPGDELTIDVVSEPNEDEKRTQFDYLFKRAKMNSKV